jgi:D-alanine-D-alanine ligase
VFVSEKGEWFTGEELIDLDNYKNLDYKKLTSVSFIAGKNILYSVRKNKIKPLFDIAVAVNCMHGERGEDGCLAGILELTKIPLASPPLLPSAVCMDKSLTKVMLKGLNIKTLPHLYLENESELESVPKSITYPLMVKPNRSGSSVGVNRADDYSSLVKAFRYAKRFGDGVIVEPCLTGFIEINCAAYLAPDKKVMVSECERPVGRTEILSFSDKYENGKRVFPADIDKKISDKIKKITKKVYTALNCRGVIRIDYFLSGDEVLINEINTVPGSLAYYLFGETMKDFSQMLNRLILVAEKDFAGKSTYTTKNNTGILKGFGSKGAKHN